MSFPRTLITLSNRPSELYVKTTDAYLPVNIRHLRHAPRIATVRCLTDKRQLAQVLRGKSAVFYSRFVRCGVHVLYSDSNLGVFPLRISDARILKFIPAGALET